MGETKDRLARMQENWRKRTLQRLNSLEYQIARSEGPFKASCYKQYLLVMKLYLQSRWTETINVLEGLTRSVKLRVNSDPQSKRSFLTDRSPIYFYVTIFLFRFIWWIACYTTNSPDVA